MTKKVITGVFQRLPYKDGESLEDQAKKILNKELNTRWFDTYLEELLSSTKYFIVDSELYEVLAENISNIDDEWCIFEQVDDNLFSYTIVTDNESVEEILENKLNEILRN